MSSTRTKIGVIVTIVWIAMILYLAFRDLSAISSMTPNEWGDFLAGTVAPLAFLWLVLGYFQQGDELRLSTNALRLQAEELKNSVEQQRELVEVSRLQVESEREALLYERQLREDLAIPKFSVLGVGGTFRGNGYSTYNINISNTGCSATDFTATIISLNDSDSFVRKIMREPMFAQGGSHTTSFESPIPLEENKYNLVLTYTDGLRRETKEIYKVGKVSADPQAALSFFLIKNNN